MPTKPLTYLTLEGVEVPYGLISTRIAGDLELKYPTDASPPTYKVESITGDTVEFPHDEESIESESATPEEKTAWAEYLIRKAEQTKRYNEEMVRACFLLGIKLSLPEDDSWLAPYRYLRLDIPEDPHDLKLFWLFKEVVKAEYDIYELTKVILGAAGAYLGMRAVAANTFRSALGQPNGAETAGPDEAVAEEQQGVVA